MRPPPPNMRAADRSGRLSSELFNYLSDLAADQTARERDLHGRPAPPPDTVLSAEARQRAEGERRRESAALQGVLGEIEQAAEERRQAAADNATLAARVRALEILANIGIGAVEAMVPPLQAPGVRPGEPPPAPPAPALPDYLGAGGARVLVATHPAIAPDPPAVATWTRAATAPAPVYFLTTAWLAPVGIPAASAAGYLRWEIEILARDGTTVQATLRVPVQRAGSATASVPYTNGAAQAVTDFTFTNRRTIAADAGSPAVGDTVLIPQTDFRDTGVELDPGNTYPGSFSLYLVPVAG